MRLRLEDAPFAGRTGRGVVVAVIDSGIHAAHPHVGGVLGGANLLHDVDDGAGDLLDRIGHGTAVAAAIREKSPAVDLLAIKVFDRQLTTSADVLARAISWAADHGARLINLSLGTANAARAELLQSAVERARANNALVVSARATNGVEWMPGVLPDVVGVEPDWSCERNELEIVRDATRVPVFRASAYPRPIPGVARERNLSGISFAVANVTGFLARGIEARGWSSVDDIVADLMLD